jgi:WhiB family redox-sensing transcriptional regulator
MEMFFPDNKSEAIGMYSAARKVCASCEWQAECGDWAIRHDSGYGMFGGLTPEDRRLLRKQMGIVNEPIKVILPGLVQHEA